MTGVTYFAKAIFCDRMRRAMSFPQSLFCPAPVGTIVLATGTKLVLDVISGLVVTNISVTGAGASNVVVAQSTWGSAGGGTTQWRAATTRFGVSSAPEHMPAPLAN